MRTVPPISHYESDTDNAPRTVPLEWPELRELLSSPRAAPCSPCAADASPPGKCPDRNGPAWSPHVLRPGSTRSNAAVESLSYLVYDLDHVSTGEALEVARRLESLDCVLHSSHSHRPERDDCALRVVVNLTRPVLAAEFPTVWRAAANLLGLRVQDEQCKDLARLYYLPSCTAARVHEFVFVQVDGPPLDVDRALAHSRSLAVPPRPALPGSDLEIDDLPDHASVDLQALRVRLKEIRRRKARRGDDKYDLLDKLVRGRAFCVPGGDRRSNEELHALGLERGRQCAVHRAASLIAFCLPAMTPTAAALELLRPCLEQVDLEPEGLPHWLDRAAESYDQAMTVRAERDLERRRLDDALRLSIGQLAGRPHAVLELAAGIEARAATEQAGESEADPTADPLKNWRDLLLRKADGATLKQYGANAYTILALDENLRGTIRFDAVEKEVTVDGGPFHGAREDVLSSEVQDWLVRNYDLNLGIEVVEQRILRVAYDNEVDPLRDWLESLAWDGRERLDEMLLKYARALTRTADGVDVEAYVRDVTRKTMTGGVARALEPGCQMDTVLVLEGPLQGEGKTSFCRIMGGRWGATTTLVLGEKDTSQLVSRSWLTELGELRSLERTDTEAMRSFLTLTEDRFRQAYGRGPRRFPRRAFFVGTTNKDTYLRDTRERRIWPVRVGDFDLAALRADREQLWAEAVHRYRQFCELRDRGVPSRDNPHRWWFERGEQRVVNEQTAARVESSHFEVKLAEWWAGCRRRPEQFTSTMVAEDVLRFTPDRVTHAVQTEVGIALRRLGFQKTRGMLHGHKQWYYVPSQELLDAPVGARSHPAGLVGNSLPHNAGAKR